MKTLLVTGGAGFIGSNFIKLFHKRHSDWKILNFDKLTYSGNLRNVESLNGDSRYEFIQADICDSKAVEAAVKKSDAIVHFAAETHVDRSIDDAEAFLKTNVIGTHVLLEVAKKHSIKRFVHISTDEVYGSLKEGAASEEALLQPNSPYSASKAASDLLARSYWKTYKLPVIVTRSSNNFGPNQYPEKVIPLFVTNLIEEKKVPLYGDGKNRRDWIHVEDNCTGVELVFEKGEPGGIYNIGIGSDISNLELTHAILKNMGASESSIQYVEDRLGHDFRYSLDIRKLEKLGFKPKWSFEDALKQTIEWYQTNRPWWEPLKKDKFTVK